MAILKRQSNDPIMLNDESVRSMDLGATPQQAVKMQNDSYVSQPPAWEPQKQAIASISSAPVPEGFSRNNQGGLQVGNDYNVKASPLSGSVTDGTYKKPDRFSRSFAARLGMKKGGFIHGKQKPKDGDNTMVPMQTGEYVLPRKTVKHIGKGALDSLVVKTTGKRPNGSPRKGFLFGGELYDPSADNEMLRKFNNRVGNQPFTQEFDPATDNKMVKTNQVREGIKKIFPQRPAAAPLTMQQALGMEAARIPESAYPQAQTVDNPRASRGPAFQTPKPARASFTPTPPEPKAPVYFNKEDLKTGVPKNAPNAQGVRSGLTVQELKEIRNPADPEYRPVQKVVNPAAGSKERAALAAEGKASSTVSGKTDMTQPRWTKGRLTEVPGALKEGVKKIPSAVVDTMKNGKMGLLKDVAATGATAGTSQLIGMAANDYLTPKYDDPSENAPDATSQRAKRVGQVAIPLLVGALTGSKQAAAASTGVSDLTQGLAAWAGDKWGKYGVGGTGLSDAERQRRNVAYEATIAKQKQRQENPPAAAVTAKTPAEIEQAAREARSAAVLQKSREEAAKLPTGPTEEEKYALIRKEREGALAQSKADNDERYNFAQNKAAEDEAKRRDDNLQTRIDRETSNLAYLSGLPEGNGKDTAAASQMRLKLLLGQQGRYDTKEKDQTVAQTSKYGHDIDLKKGKYLADESGEVRKAEAQARRDDAAARRYDVDQRGKEGALNRTHLSEENAKIRLEQEKIRSRAAVEGRKLAVAGNDKIPVNELGNRMTIAGVEDDEETYDIQPYKKGTKSSFMGLAGKDSPEQPQIVGKRKKQGALAGNTKTTADPIEAEMKRRGLI